MPEAREAGGACSGCAWHALPGMQWLRLCLIGGYYLGYKVATIMARKSCSETYTWGGYSLPGYRVACHSPAIPPCLGIVVEHYVLIIIYTSGGQEEEGPDRGHQAKHVLLSVFASVSPAQIGLAATT